MALPLQNYMTYAGGAGVYTYTFEYERKDTCAACGTNLVRMSLPATATLEQLIERLAAESTMYASSCPA
jgi:NEDD8-activating enzyme E1